jgi:hypothetical protein
LRQEISKACTLRTLPNAFASVQAVSFGEDALRFHTKVTVDRGVMPEGYDGAWTRNFD